MLGKLARKYSVVQPGYLFRLIDLLHVDRHPQAHTHKYRYRPLVHIPVSLVYYVFYRSRISGSQGPRHTRKLSVGAHIFTASLTLTFQTFAGP